MGLVWPANLSELSGVIGDPGKRVLGYRTLGPLEILNPLLFGLGRGRPAAEFWRFG